MQIGNVTIGGGAPLCLIAGPCVIESAEHACRTAERLAAIARGQSALQRVDRLVDGLLQFARAGAAAGRSASADVPEVVEDVVAELGTAADDAQVALRLEVDGARPVTCSPGVLTSVVSNLVRNAITHMGESEVRAVSIRARPSDSSDRLRVEVEDTGPGVPAALGDRIFEPFVRGPAAGPSGTGLGLATAKRLVEAHGGSIGYRPGPACGTVFWFEPVATGAGAPVGASSSAHARRR